MASPRPAARVATTCVDTPVRGPAAFASPSAGVGVCTGEAARAPVPADFDVDVGASALGSIPFAM